MTNVINKNSLIPAEYVIYNFAGEGKDLRKDKQLVHVGGNMAIGYEDGCGILLYEMAGNPGAWEIGDNDHVLHDIYDDGWLSDVPIEKLASMSVLEFMLTVAERKAKKKAVVS
ncbi:hypothetical protein [Bacillus amyloliquefaciens]|uniref:hypothetical protein n=1 Tax=Bacillus amyloliquefaciens TaxID=1390 RepID=UPI0011C74EDF|nr:hypothetical protein [Bacillus amyloliquefaciens]TXK24366.1 hypothetical protein FVD42_10315 [Bacillus amyloliquefaciens]TXK30582.1 hypothetical protein FVD41_10250 [Bacillus amyloliquefaciens]